MVYSPVLVMAILLSITYSAVTICSSSSIIDRTHEEIVFWLIVLLHKPKQELAKKDFTQC